MDPSFRLFIETRFRTFVGNTFVPIDNRENAYRYYGTRLGRLHVFFPEDIIAVYVIEATKNIRRLRGMKNDCRVAQQIESCGAFLGVDTRDIHLFYFLRSRGYIALRTGFQAGTIYKVYSPDRNFNRKTARPAFLLYLAEPELDMAVFSSHFCAAQEYFSPELTLVLGVTSREVFVLLGTRSMGAAEKILEIVPKRRRKKEN